MANRDAMPSRGPVMTSGVVAVGEQPTVDGVTWQDDTDREFPAVYIKVGDNYAGVCVYNEDAATCKANADLIAAAFSASTAARDIGFDAIGAIEALPELLAFIEVADRHVGLLIADTASEADFDKYEDAKAAALSAARKRGDA